MALEAWLIDESDEDQRLPHHRNPKEFVTLSKLEELGVLYWHLDPRDYENDELKKIRESRGYNHMVMRLFAGEPIRTAYNSPQEDHPARKGYIKNLFDNPGVALEAH